jgi:hypothetical protein
MNYLLVILRYIALIQTYLQKAWDWFWGPDPVDGPVRRYFLSDEDEFDETYTRVPEDAVYVEEWVQDNKKKCVIRYEGEEIPKEWTSSPFDLKPRCPWIWVGDKETEIDLTRTFNKFLVVGNRIELALVLKLIQITDRTNLIYIEAGTFEERKFPGEGITIEEDENSLSDS